MIHGEVSNVSTDRLSVRDRGQYFPIFGTGRLSCSGTRNTVPARCKWGDRNPAAHMGLGNADAKVWGEEATVIGLVARP